MKLDSEKHGLSVMLIDSDGNPIDFDGRFTVKIDDLPDEQKRVLQDWAEQMMRGLDELAVKKLDEGKIPQINRCGNCKYWMTIECPKEGFGVMPVDSHNPKVD